MERVCVRVCVSAAGLEGGVRESPGVDQFTRHHLPAQHCARSGEQASKGDASMAAIHLSAGMLACVRTCLQKT